MQNPQIKALVVIKAWEKNPRMTYTNMGLRGRFCNYYRHVLNHALFGGVVCGAICPPHYTAENMLNVHSFINPVNRSVSLFLMHIKFISIFKENMSVWTPPHPNCKLGCALYSDLAVVVVEERRWDKMEVPTKRRKQYQQPNTSRIFKLKWSSRPVIVLLVKKWYLVTI